MLILFLKRHAGQHITAAEITGPYITEQCAVGRTAVPVVITHAVGHHAPFLGRCHDHLTARTHTEGINTTSCRRAVGSAAIIDFVFGRRQPQLPPRPAVLGNVNHILWMLDPHTDGKWFLFHGDAAFMEHAEGIPRTVAHRQNQRLTGNFCQIIFLLAVILQIADGNGPNTARLQMDRFQSGIKPHFTAQTDDLLPDVFHHNPQQVRTDMWPLLI